MKKLLLILLITPVLCFGQIVLDVKMIKEKYNGTAIGGYFDRYGELLFDGAAAEHNISEFKNYNDFDEIWTYDETLFEGRIGKSNMVNIKYYVNASGKPSSIKTVFFKNYDEAKDQLVQLGTVINLSRDGTIKSLIHR